MKTAEPIKKNTTESGFTLLEVILAIGILSTISFYCITTLKNLMDARNKTEIVNNEQHALHAAMTHVFNDLRHAFVISKVNAIAFGLANLAIKPGLIVRFSNYSTLSFTTQNNVSFEANSPKSNLAIAGYEVRPSATDPSKQILIRRIDTDLAESLEKGGKEQVLLKDVKEFKVTFFDGLEFSSTDWDTGSTNSNGILPKMAKIKISTWTPPTEVQQQLSALATGGDQTEQQRPFQELETIVYLIYTAGERDSKEPSKEYKWQ